MSGKVFAALCIAAIVAALVTGDGAALTAGALAGAERAVTLSLSLCGMMCLWSGLLEVLREAGALDKLSGISAGLLRRIFPRAFRDPKSAGCITACICANLLGMGNAATPFALSAIRQIQSTAPDPTRAEDDAITLTVLCCCSLNLIPSTLIALRHAAGSSSPGEILIPVWIVSGCCALFGILICRLASRIGAQRRTREVSHG